MADPVYAVRSIFVAASPAAVFDEVFRLENWPRWAVHNVRSARLLPEGGCAIETPRGPGQIRPHFVREHGVLDHEFIDPREGAWLVPARVAPFAGGSVLTLALAKPPAMPREAFDQGMALLDDELAHLKRLIEAGRPPL